jgi:hypothetical protein
LRHFIFNLLFLTLLSACGKGFEEEETLSFETIPSGLYTVNFYPLNQRVGPYLGLGKISHLDNQFWTQIKIYGPSSSTMHMQLLHQKADCPDLSHDLNHDGYLDMTEVFAEAGKILIPLDGNLSSQLKGFTKFPFMKKKRNFYFYSNAADGRMLLRDLRSVEDVSSLHLVKLGALEEINLSQRVIIIYGIPDAHALPQTVKSFGLFTPQAGLPVACGKISGGASFPFF